MRTRRDYAPPRLELIGKQTILNAEGYNLCVFTAFRGINSIVLISSAELFTFA
jgi:hypothetical protein